MNCCLLYDFPGDDIPIIKGSALAALEGRDDAIGKAKVIELMAAVDSYIPNRNVRLTSHFDAC